MCSGLASNLAVSVIGYVGSGSNRMHVGKSCLIHRFLSRTKYTEDHLCVLSPLEFDSEIVGRSHWLYWGEENVYIQQNSYSRMHIIEQCEFVDDHLYTPFTSPQSYIDRCLGRYITVESKKLTYLCKSQLGNESSFPRTYFGPGTLTVAAYVCVYDVTVQQPQAFQQFLFLQRVLRKLSSAKLPLVLVTSKNDLQVSPVATDLLHEALRGIKRRWIKHHFCIVDTSARMNVNVVKPFHHAASIASGMIHLLKRNHKRCVLHFPVLSKQCKNSISTKDSRPLAPYYLDPDDCFKATLLDSPVLNSTPRPENCIPSTRFGVLPFQPKDPLLYSTITMPRQSHSDRFVSTVQELTSHIPHEDPPSVLPTPPPLLVPSALNFRLFDSTHYPGSNKEGLASQLSTCNEPLSRIHVYGEESAVRPVVQCLHQACPLDRFLAKNGVLHRIWVFSDGVSPLPDASQVSESPVRNPLTDLQPNSSSNSITAKLTSTSHVSAFSTPSIGFNGNDLLPSKPDCPTCFVNTACEGHEKLSPASHNYLQLLVYNSVDGLEKHSDYLGRLQSHSTWFLLLWTSTGSNWARMIFEGASVASKFGSVLLVSTQSSTHELLNYLIQPQTKSNHLVAIDSAECGAFDWICFDTIDCEPLLPMISDFQSETDNNPILTALVSFTATTSITLPTNSNRPVFLSPSVVVPKAVKSVGQNSTRSAPRYMTLNTLLKFVKITPSQQSETRVVFLHYLVQQWLNDEQCLDRAIQSLVETGCTMFVLVLIHQALASSLQTMEASLKDLADRNSCSFHVLRDPVNCCGDLGTDMEQKINNVAAISDPQFVLFHCSASEPASYRLLLEGDPGIWSQFPGFDLLFGHNQSTVDYAQPELNGSDSHSEDQIPHPVTYASLPILKSYEKPANPPLDHNLSVEEYYAELPKMSAPASTYYRSCRRFNRPKRPFPRTNSDTSCCSSSCLPIMAGHPSDPLAATYPDPIPSLGGAVCESEPGVYAEVNDAVCGELPTSHFCQSSSIAGKSQLYDYVILPPVYPSSTQLHSSPHLPRALLNSNEQGTAHRIGFNGVRIALTPPPNRGYHFAVSRPLPSIQCGPTSVSDTSHILMHSHSQQTRTTTGDSAVASVVTVHSKSACKVSTLNPLVDAFRRSTSWFRDAISTNSRQKKKS